MKSYNIAKLKAQVSSIIKEVSQGEEIVVTDHNRPVAKIVPLRHIEPLPKISLKELFNYTPFPLKKGALSSAELTQQIRDEARY